MLTLFAGHRHRMMIALKSKSDVCSVQVVPLRLADDRVSQSAAWTKTGRPSRHSQTWPCRGNVESQHVDWNSFETAQILIQWSNRSFCYLPSTQLTYPLCLRWLFRPSLGSVDASVFHVPSQDWATSPSIQLSPLLSTHFCCHFVKSKARQKEEKYPITGVLLRPLAYKSARCVVLFATSRVVIILWLSCYSLLHSGLSFILLSS